MTEAWPFRVRSERPDRHAVRQQGRRRSGEFAHMPGPRSTLRANLARAIAVATSLWAAGGHAAGGHFAVDDAAILDVGTCGVEAWWERADPAGSLLHLGPACRVGPVELAINADRIQPRDRARADAGRPADQMGDADRRSRQRRPGGPGRVARVRATLCRSDRVRAADAARRRRAAVERQRRPGLAARPADPLARRRFARVARGARVDDHRRAVSPVRRRLRPPGRSMAAERIRSAST